MKHKDVGCMKFMMSHSGTFFHETLSQKLEVSTIQKSETSLCIVMDSVIDFRMEFYRMTLGSDKFLR